MEVNKGEKLMIYVFYESRKCWADRNQNLKNNDDLSRFLEDDQSIEKIIKFLSKEDFNVVCVEINTENIQKYIYEAKQNKNCIIWNLTDGMDYYKGSNLPALANLYDIPYVGSNSYVQMLAQNKQHMKTIVKSLGIQVANGINVTPGSYPTKKLDFQPPYFIKPTCFDNSIGDNVAYPVCTSLDEAEKTVKQLFENNYSDVMIEEYLSGNEYSVTLINIGKWVADCVKIEYPGCSYWSSISKDNRQYEITEAPSDIEDDLVRKSVLLATSLHINDYFRVDYRCNASNEPKFLEINTNPFLMCLAYKQLASKYFSSIDDMLSKMIYQSFRRQQ